MILLAAQVTIVLKADNKAEASTYTAIQAAQDEYIETRSDTEAPERDAEYISISEDEQNWIRKDSDILLRIAMAEAEGEGTEGKALVMNVILNRVESEEFPDSIEAVVFQPGQFESVLDDGRYWDVEPDAECYNEASVDYINCVSFGRSAEFAEKYFHKGTKIVIAGRIQTGSYTNKDGQKVYTTDIVIEEQDFAESKAASQQNNSGNAQNASNNQQAQQPKPQTSPDGFMSADDGEELPFY